MFGKFGNMKMTPEQKRLWNILWFLIRLLVLSIPLYLIIFLAVDLTPMQATVASQTSYILESMGFNVIQEGYHIIVGTIEDHFYFMINEDCTGWKSMLFLFALIFAVPRISWKKRFIGLIIGIPIIWIANLGRVIGVVLAERMWGLEFAMSLHDYGYRLGMIAVVLLIWLIWFRLSKEKEKNILGRLSDLFGRG